jgi:hypothetical protein
MFINYKPIYKCNAKQSGKIVVFKNTGKLVFFFDSSSADRLHCLLLLFITNLNFIRHTVPELLNKTSTDTGMAVSCFKYR